ALLLSCADARAKNDPIEEQAIIPIQLPAESAVSIDAFLDYWRPDFVLWTAGNLRPIFVDRITRRSIPFGLVAAEADLLSKSSWRWFTGSSRTSLGKLTFIFTRDAASFRIVEQMKLESVDVAFGGPLLESAVTLPYNETEREEMAELLLGRQVWLATHVSERELPVILNAHRQIIRYSHRAVLIVVPDQTADPERCMSVIEKSAMRMVRWSEGEMPEESTQVVFADVEGELGLWYRLAPIAFMGNSLFPEMKGSDPNEPAAHGAAILHGPNLGNRTASYALFTEVAAARQVADESTLAAAVTRLIQPDQCAAMAHTAWEVASRGAVLTDMIAERVLDQIEQTGPRG
ncbi:MAG: glycosyltransferase N-terminal domain-containing protein, partial [Pseudomonadota bacterium]